MDKPTRALDATGTAVAVADVAGSPSTIVAAAAGGPLVWPDRPAGPDALDRAEQAAFLAEVIAHPGLETPFCIGLFGAAGSGKTFFLDQVIGAADRPGQGTDGAPGLGTLTVRVDAGRPGAPGALLADALIERLADTYPALAADLLHAGADPAEVARGANQALDDLRRRHQAERATLDELGGRNARLADTVLDTPGTSLDAYARARRAPIERALRRFGFDAADGLATYKALAREVVEAPGVPARIVLGLHALWTYRGQARLLVLAAVSALLAFGVAAVAGDQEGWLAALRGTGDKGGPLADWAGAHAGWLGPLQTGLVLLALLCLATNLWRGARFLRPIFKGATLHARDLDVRSRDLKGLLAHQTRRVDGLAAEVEAAARQADEADRRAGARAAGGADLPRRAALHRPPDEAARAKALFEGLGAIVGRADGPDARADRPDRIVVALDNLDARPPTEAAAWTEAARLLLGPGFVCLLAANRTHLVDGFGETDPGAAIARFERCVQLSYRLDAGSADGATWSRYATRLIGGASAPEAPAPVVPRRAALDRPWRPREAETLTALAVFAGDTPRAIKRYVNLYRIARADPQLHDAAGPVFTALALALALDGNGYPEDLDALAKASHGEAAGDSGLLRRALAVARDASGAPVELAQAQRALDVAGRYATRG